MISRIFLLNFLDYVDDETEGNSVRNNGNGPPQPKLPNEDVEHIIRAGNIVPKPLPQVTPDACPSPNPPFGYRGSPTPRLIPGVKRKCIVFTENNTLYYIITYCS